MTGLYLSLRVFIHQELEEKITPIYIKNKSNYIREFLEESNKIHDDLLVEIDLDDDANLAEIHSLGTIVAKYYKAENIPSTDVLVEDVSYFLDLYNDILENYTDKMDISADEWVEVLSNKDVIDCKMYSILQIMNDSEDKSALSSEISEKRKELGFDDEISYNSTIVHNSRRVKEYLEKKPIFSEAGKEIFWMRFFYGKKLRNGFEFILKEELIEALKRVNRNIEDEGEGCMSKNNHDSFYDCINEKYLFEKEIVENYLLSLKVKPFVILTGNSGTGKTKLAQLFARYLNQRHYLHNNSLDSEYVTVSAKTNYSSWANTGWSLNKNDFKDIIPLSECEGSFDLNIDGINAEGTISLVVQLYYDKKNLEMIDHFKKLYSIDPNQIVDLKIKKENIKEFCSNDFIETKDSITLKQKSNKTAYAERQWNLSKDYLNYTPFSRGSTKCNILVDGIESSARILIVPILTFKKNDKLQKYLKENEGKDVNVEIKIDKFDFDNFKPIWEKTDDDKSADLENRIDDNYEIIPVGANWTENRNIVGYHNIITDKYEKTPAYNLIKKSQDSTEPHFLILDEMNLSHVERYFADFLSAIESGEDIPIYSEGEDDLKIPDNLFIIGTVNVDETTYMFSPKVLDRANVIEFKTYPPSDYMKNQFKTDSLSGNVQYLENPLDEDDIRKKGIDELRELFVGVTVNGESFWEILSKEINEFQDILKESGFDFGFRVINEIVRFMAVAWKYDGEKSEFTNWTRYFDACIKQKMLPKLHGSEKIIGKTLNSLYQTCLSSAIDNEEMAKYPESYKKLKEMKKVLREQRYVSFIN